MSLTVAGRNAIITGASQGLGKAIAEAYVRAGANVCLCSRDPVPLGRVAAELSTLAVPGQRVEAVPADVSREEDVLRLVGIAVEGFSRIHVLVNNAGVLGPIGRIEDIDWSEWVRTIAINLFGSALCCRALVPHFKAHRYGKIVQLSGGGATSPMPNLTAYAASKAGIVRFMETLAEETREFGIDINAVAPGAMDTQMLDQVLAGGPSRVGQTYYDRMKKIKESGGAPLDQGAALAVFLGSAASDGITGRLLSAAWDPWESLADRRADLDGTDVYTLRRIVPKDRGFTWGDR